MIKMGEGTYLVMPMTYNLIIEHLENRSLEGKSKFVREMAYFIHNHYTSMAEREKVAGRIKNFFDTGGYNINIEDKKQAHDSAIKSQSVLSPNPIEINNFSIDKEGKQINGLKYLYHK